MLGILLKHKKDLPHYCHELNSLTKTISTFSKINHSTHFWFKKKHDFPLEEEEIMFFAFYRIIEPIAGKYFLIISDLVGV